MALKFYYNNTTYSLADYTASTSSASTFDSQAPAIFHYYQNTGSSSTADHKIPASSTRGTSVQFAEDDNYYYKMDNSSPTLCFRKNDTTYYCAKSITTEAKIVYDIPAGTYTPSVFENLIKQYISINGSRKVSNDFTVTVNGQTVSVSSGSFIYYIDNSSSGSTLRGICFGIYNPEDVAFSGAVALSSGFTKYKTYITYRSTSAITAYYFDNYANYNITVTTGINFS